MVDLNNVNNLVVVLQLLCANDSATIKQGEKALKPFLKNASCAIPLMQVLRGGSDDAVRHQAALLLRKKMEKFYPKYNAQQQATLRTELVGFLLSEQTPVIATAIAGMIAATASAIYKNKGQWPEVFQLLLQLVQDPNEKHRILTFKLLSELAESIPSQLKPHANTLSQLFLAGCQDPVNSVAEASLSAIGTALPILGKTPEIMALTQVITPMIGVLNRCLSTGDDDLVIEGLGVFQECCLLEQPLINDHIEVVVQFVIAILLHPEHDSSLKQAAGQTLMDVIEYRPKLFAKKNLVAPTLSMLMDRIAKEQSSVAGALFHLPANHAILEDEKDDDDEDYDPSTEVQKLSQTIIDTMAIHVPSKYFTDTVLSMISQGMSSPDPHMRKAGCAVLGVVAEGCHERLRESLDSILPALLGSLDDPNIFVRECASFSLGQFAEHCQPEILNYHDTVLPSVFKAMNDQTEIMQATSCYILEHFCEYLQPATLKPYLAPLMNKLGELAQSKSRGIQEMALTALSATAIAAEHEFEPYAQGVMGFLTQLLFLTEPTQLTTRGKALDCVGHIAIALGKEKFQQAYFEIGMKSAMQGFEMDNELLKEHGFIFIANIVKLMEKGFEPFMAQLIPYLHTIIEESEIFKVISDDEGDDPNAQQQEEDDDDEDADYRVNIMEGFISTKKAAITALGALAEHTKSCFLPYLQNSVELLITDHVGALYSFHDDIRAESVSVLDYFIEVLCEARGVKVPTKREVLQLPQDVLQLTAASFKSCVHILIKDDEKVPVSNALETIHAILKRLGPVVLTLPVTDENNENPKPFASILLDQLLIYLNEKAKCQTANKLDRSTEGENGEDDDDDHDHVVIDSVADLIGCLATLLGGDFVQYFDTFHPKLMKFTKSSRSTADRVMAVGCYSEVFDEIGPLSLKYAEPLLPVIKSCLEDSVENCRRNAAYCIGTLIEKTDRALVPHFIPILQWLHPICVRKEKERSDYVGGADIDNAISSVAKMIHVAPEAVPLQQVLPVVFAALPMREDYDESTVVFSTIHKLIQINEPTTLSMLPQVLTLLGSNFLGSCKHPDETRVIAAESFKLLASNPQYAPHVQSYIGSITDAEQSQRLQQALQSS